VLGVATDPDAVDRIEDLTGRRGDPLPVAVDSVRYASRLIDIREEHEEFIAHAWPGAWTAVAPAKGNEGEFVSQLMHAPNGTLGVRVPGRDTFESALSNELERPIVTTAVRYPDGRPVRQGDEALRIVTDAMSMRGTETELVGFTARDQFRYDTHSTVGRMVRTERLIELIREGAMPWREVEALIRRITKRSWEDPEAQEDIT
jgi:tRNA A37 threonylcarbamoyladenosine synthetase subunit TsaC/SUA5/YrdC